MSRDTEKNTRQDKRATALRDNLLKRKTQARERAAAPSKEKK